MSLRTTRWASVLCAPMLLAAAAAARGDLLAYYEFDKFNDPAPEVLLDSTGNGNHAIARNRGIDAPSLLDGSTGLTGEASDRSASFPGGGDLYLPSVNNGAEAGAFQSMIDSQEFTLTYWVKSAGYINAFLGWLEPGRSISAAPWSNQNYYLDTGGCCGADQRLFTPYDEPDDEWHFWAVTRNDFGDKMIYYDGDLLIDAFDQTAPLQGPSEGAPNQFFIGSELGNTNFYIGEMDEYAIFDEAMSLDDLDSIYADGVREFVGGLPDEPDFFVPQPGADSALVNLDGKLGGAVYSIGDGTVASWKVERVFTQAINVGTPDEKVFHPVLDLTPAGAAGDAAVGDAGTNVQLGEYPLIATGIDDEIYDLRLTVLTEGADPFLGDVTQIFETSIVVPGSGGGGGCDSPLAGQGDINCDNAVDLLDFNILKANFGASAESVPEPGSLALLAGAGCCGLWSLRRRRA